MGAHRLVFFIHLSENFDTKSKCKLSDPSHNTASCSVGEKNESKPSFSTYPYLYKAGAPPISISRYRDLIVWTRRYYHTTRCSSQPLQRPRQGVHCTLAIPATLSHPFQPATLTVEAHHALSPHGRVVHHSTAPRLKRLIASYRMMTCSLKSSTRTSRTAHPYRAHVALRRIQQWESLKLSHSQQYEICLRCTKSCSQRKSTAERGGHQAPAPESQEAGLRSI